MRLVLAQNAVYVPAFGGANKSNRLLMESFAARGHQCLVVAAATGVQAGSRRSLVDELASRGIAVSQQTSRVVEFTLNGVAVQAVTDPLALREHLREAIGQFAPTWTLVSSEDPGQKLLETSLAASPDRVVYLARTTMALPCGPDSVAPNPKRAQLLQRVAGIVTVSKYLRAYVREWAGVEAVHLPISPPGPGPFPNVARFDRGDLTLVNPCALKGLPIFLGLADAFPARSFAAVPTWGTTAQDLDALRQRPNVTIVPPCDRIEEIFRRSRALLVPSLWAEAHARVIGEAMRHGLPVLASDVGGIAEAMAGVDYLLPVNPIARFQSRLNERMLPVVDVPPQPLHLWADALRDLLSSERRYQEVAEASRLAANARPNEGAKPLETYLSQLTPSDLRSATVR